MKSTKKDSENNISKKVIKKKKVNTLKPAAEKFDDVNRLVHLLQVHQVELEHQNQELRITQEELEESRNKYVNLYDFSPIPYFTIDHNGKIVEVNLSASKMFGYDRKRLIGKQLISFVQLMERDIYNYFFNALFSSDIKHTCELILMNKEKNKFYVRLEGIKLEDTNEPDQKCQIAVIDLTEYKRIESSLKKTNDGLKELNTTKDKLFSIIAHDLRSPFQSLLGLSEILATEIETLSKDEIITFSKGFNKQLSKFYSLLDNLLNWSMIQSDILKFKYEKINFNDIVNNSIELLNQNAVVKNISIVNKINKVIYVNADSNMLRLVIQNLITNAIKFTPEKGEIFIEANENGDLIEVVVMDNGIGIDPSKIDLLFDFNTQITSEGTAGEKGTGLGLPLCKEFVERNNGKIWIESEPGKGSKFIFTLQKSLT